MQKKALNTILMPSFHAIMRYSLSSTLKNLILNTIITIYTIWAHMTNISLHPEDFMYLPVNNTIKSYLKLNGKRRIIISCYTLYKIRHNKFSDHSITTYYYSMDKVHLLFQTGQIWYSKHKHKSRRKFKKYMT
jgi:hypothetical protein